MTRLQLSCVSTDLPGGSLVLVGGAKGIRTPDLLVANARQWLGKTVAAVACVALRDQIDRRSCWRGAHGVHAVTASVSGQPGSRTVQWLRLRAVRGRCLGGCPRSSRLARR